MRYCSSRNASTSVRVSLIIIGVLAAALAVRL
jgi:hypothetical protein